MSDLDNQNVQGHYKLFKHGYPNGTITEFNAYMERLGELHKSLQPCPFCCGEAGINVYQVNNEYSDGDLRREVFTASAMGLEYNVACGYVDCHVSPKTDPAPTMEEAVEYWRHK